ncbi:MAG: DUF327 family protein [Candidatus Melainabacteria bacterium]|jgi:uncharacterized protein YaaR (DUF327 family)|nr:DUF327 family protein [Candidatus Melainabacteria bacterium]
MSLNAISGIGNNSLDAFQRPSAKDAATDADSKVADSAKLTEASTKSIKKPNFLERLKAVAEPQLKQKPEFEAMQDRLAGLRAKGVIVLHYPIDANVKSYVNDLKDFLADIRDHAYDSQSQDDNFQRIDIVDSKLDALAEELLATEQAELSLVDSLGELQGLIIDIYV